MFFMNVLFLKESRFSIGKIEKYFELDKYKFIDERHWPLHIPYMFNKRIMTGKASWLKDQTFNIEF